ncbi:hypothetical protein ARMSODRAFT_958467 [Armillaria solidipes]|uniref:Uncharacterized protein n=1 Tax=Armillaria solidipes TaxID=1076256 RepID=A0A2H3BBW4_9AGAR|nr:hypothetical protein ARMSODRAFT_958467 [Armillaria solidipes]
MCQISKKGQAETLRAYEDANATTCRGWSMNVQSIKTKKEEERKIMMSSPQRQPAT